MKKEQTKLSTKEFLTLYTGILFEVEDIENAINKVFGISPYTLTALRCAEQFIDYVDNNRPDLVAAVAKVGVFDAENMPREIKLQARKIWLEEMEKVLGKEIEVDKMSYKDASQPSSL